MIKLVICGVAGRMGQAILSQALKDKSIEVVGLTEAKDNPLVGEKTQGIHVQDDIKNILNQADAVIDFTSPQSSLANARAVAEAQKKLVVGTTGLQGKEKEQFIERVKAIPCVLSPNMSLSANVMFNITETVSRLLPGYDAEVTEIHHNLKKDSPSGTAQRLADSVKQGRQKGEYVYGRHGLVGERKPDEIGVHAIRGGDVVGDHTVLFMGHGERIELTHRMSSREAFANGSIVAAKWLANKPAGLYDMRDVLGLK